MTSRLRVRLVLPAVVLCGAHVVVACVGDDPVTASSGTSSGGVPEGGGIPSESGAADQFVGADARDAADAAKSCKPLAPFDTPALLGGVNLPGIAVNGARLAPDETTIYYGRRSPPSGTPAYIDELFFVTRSSATAPFGASSPLLSDTNYNKRGANPTLTADQNTMFFNTTGFVPGATNLAVAIRPSSATGFTTAGAVSFVGGPSDSADPYVNADGSRVYYTSSGNIYVASKQGTSYADIVQVVPAAASTGFSHPVVAPDELTMWLQKTDAGGLATAKVFVTQRKGLDVAFDVPVAVDSLNAQLPASPTWISPDGCNMYLTVAHKMPPVVDTGSLVETHIFRATRAPE